jgi:hypothetical protein
VEVGGPEQFRFDELIRLGLSARNDPRNVIADPHARYFGTELSEYSLVPGNDALLGEIRFEDWLASQTLVEQKEIHHERGRFGVAGNTR